MISEGTRGKRARGGKVETTYGVIEEQRHGERRWWRGTVKRGERESEEKVRTFIAMISDGTQGKAGERRKGGRRHIGLLKSGDMENGGGGGEEQ